MKKILFMLFLFSTVKIFSQSIEVKSLKVYAGNDETSFPVIVLGSNSQQYITIEFDVKAAYIPYMNIVFRFCDRNWVPYKNIFLLNLGKNIDHDLGFYRLPHTVKDADFHFIGTYPDLKGYVEFPFSGKWMFYVTDSRDTSIVYASGKFYVVYPEMDVQDTIKDEKLEDKIYFPTDLAKVFNIKTNFNLPQRFYPQDVDQVEIIENHKIDYPVIIDRKFNTNTRYYHWDANRTFSFSARDILPGNEYRQVDLRNTDIYIAKDVNAHLDKIDYSRFYTEGEPDLNGGSILTNYNNDYATYLNVTFSFRPPNSLSEGIFLVGAFNNWKISDKYKMINNYGLYSITVPLKRGIYDYQYVISDYANGTFSKADWVTLEGNNWETTDLYNIFVYYNDPNYGGYDRIIGYRQKVSK